MGAQSAPANMSYLFFGLTAPRPVLGAFDPKNEVRPILQNDGGVLDAHEWSHRGAR